MRVAFNNPKKFPDAKDYLADRSQRHIHDPKEQQEALRAWVAARRR